MHRLLLVAAMCSKLSVLRTIASNEEYEQCWAWWAWLLIYGCGQFTEAPPKLSEGCESSALSFASLIQRGEASHTLKPYRNTFRNGTLCCTRTNLVQPWPSICHKACVSLQTVCVLICVCTAVLVFLSHGGYVCGAPIWLSQRLNLYLCILPPFSAKLCSNKMCLVSLWTYSYAYFWHL